MKMNILSKINLLEPYVQLSCAKVRKIQADQSSLVNTLIHMDLLAQGNAGPVLVGPHTSKQMEPATIV